MSDLTDRLRCFDRPTCTEAADCIEALEKSRDYFEQRWNEAMSTHENIAALKSRISELEAELAAMRAGGEPVAWAATSEDGDVEALGMNQSRRFDTPLYTHPQPAAQDAERKPLTEEQVSLAFRRGIYQWMTPGSAFAAGVRSAERAHGIAAQQGDSHE